jgi:formate dehydrogenase maturation protein FdhE
MSNWWDKQIQRADELVERSNGSNVLMTFYAQLLRSQKAIYDYLLCRQGSLSSGELERDELLLLDGLTPLLDIVHTYGPEALAAEAKSLLESPEILADVLKDYWNSPCDVQFFGKACLQPYLKWLVDTGVKPQRGKTSTSERQCPFCSGTPQVSFLQHKETTGEGGNRSLICGSCLNSWEFRRVVCANCGEERPPRLAYFQSLEFDHIRIEACDSCKHYIKGIDLTRLGHAVPLVDEIYAAPLDLWAADHGYTKIELNLVGI